MSESVAVYLERCRGYDPQLLDVVLARVLSRVGDLRVSPGTRVLLKPNLISAGAPSLACTHAALIAAVAAWFLDHGCRVVVGDSPAFGSARHVARRHGVVDALQGLGVPIVAFDSVINRRLPSGICIGVAAQALECDLFVNLPKIKAHDQMYVTMAVKNIFGIVKGPRKSWIHMRYGHSHLAFAGIIHDLLGLLPEHITIADGIEVMHRRGPMHGEPLELGCLAVSRSPVALDTAMLEILDLNPVRSPLWSVAAEREEPGVQISDIEFPLLPPSAFKGSGFVAPATLNPVRFRPWRYLYNSLRRFVLVLHRREE